MSYLNHDTIKWNPRSSHRRCSVRKGVLRKFTKYTRKHLCLSLFFNKVAGLRPATLLKKRLRRRCFPMNYAKFLTFSQITSGQLLLKSLSERILKWTYIPFYDYRFSRFEQFYKQGNFLVKFPLCKISKIEEKISYSWVFKTGFYVV